MLGEIQPRTKSQQMIITANRIFTIGDTHAEWGRLNKWLSRHNYPDVVLQVGDFGWWPHYHNRAGLLSGHKLFDQYGIRNKNTKIFWCDGNHENHDDLQELVEKHGRVPIETSENIFYCPRGSVVTINNTNFLFFGGATSIDKARRVPGDSWWAGENISERDIYQIPDIKIDIVISHDAPAYFKLRGFNNEHDYNRKALNTIFDKYRPYRWMFGHYHCYQYGYTRGCKWHGLSNIEGEQKFAKELNI